MFIIALSGASRAVTSFNARSAVGINLAPVNYFTPEQPFINSFLTSERWIPHSDGAWDTHEESYIDLDANGWPKSLKSVNEPTAQRFTSLGVVFLLGMPNTTNGIYPAGPYVVLYDGEGTLSYGLDAALVRRSPGRDTLNVTPTNSGIDLRIVATDPRHTGNYLRNIRVIAAANEAAAKGGQLFNPAFLHMVRYFRALRFMDWFATNGSTLSSWKGRVMPGNAFYGASKGVPIEIAVQLANAVSADAWMNVPVMADDDFIRRMAVLVHGGLGGSQKVYVELSNEVWNPAFGQYKHAVGRGGALWPARPSGRDGYAYNRQWYGMRTAQMCDIWRSVWGADPRLVCVLAAQAAWTPSATESLTCEYWTQGAPCAKHSIDAVAMAPYLGGPVPAAWASQPNGLDKLFESLYSRNDPSIPLGGFLSQDTTWVKDFIAKLAPFMLPLLAYEGGQNFANGNPDALNKVYIAANRDPRMGAAYARYFKAWKTAGGQLFMYYSDVGVGSQYGSWGALESIMQTTSPPGSAPPKWQAIQTFIAENPCWWTGCSP